MFRPSSRYVSTVLEVCFDRARGMVRPSHEVCFDRSRGMFRPSLEVCFDQAGVMFRLCTKYVSTMLEFVSSVAWVIFLPCSKNVFDQVDFDHRPSYVSTVLEVCFDLARSMF